MHGIERVFRCRNVFKTPLRVPITRPAVIGETLYNGQIAALTYSDTLILTHYISRDPFDLFSTNHICIFSCASIVKALSVSIFFAQMLTQ